MHISISLSPLSTDDRSRRIPWSVYLAVEYQQVFFQDSRKTTGAYFLYFCKSIIHHPQPPIAAITPSTHVTAQPLPTTIIKPAAAPRTNTAVRRTCRFHDICFKVLLKTGKRPNTWMLKSMREKTWEVSVSREASTTEEVIAALVENEAGKLRSMPLP